MVEVRGYPVKTPLLRIAVLLAVEVIASVGVWHGTPTDWRGEPPHFWHFEVLRLQYWCLFGLSFATIWAAEWMSSRRRVLARLLAVLGAACVLGTEVLTSLCFWRRLSPSETAYLAWQDLQRYTYEHLILWAALTFFGMGLWYLWRKRKKGHPAFPAVAPSR
jgi:hypothetical protein